MFQELPVRFLSNADTELLLSFLLRRKDGRIKAHLTQIGGDG